MNLLDVVIPGQPRGQGSLHLYRNQAGKEVARYSDHTSNHRNLAIDAIRKQWGRRPLVTDAVSVSAWFYFPRPKSHFGTGRNAKAVKESAPSRPVSLGRNDVDKLQRLIGDALVIAGVLQDDAQIVTWVAGKAWDQSGRGGHTELAVRLT